MTYNELFSQAKKSIEKLSCGDEFTLSKLLFYSGWEELKPGEKIKFGKHFKQIVRNNHIPEIILIPESCPAKYRKIKNS